MDKEGYIPISLIASFNRVQDLTNDIQLIFEVYFFARHVIVINRNVSIKPV